MTWVMNGVISFVLLVEHMIALKEAPSSHRTAVEWLSINVSFQGSQYIKVTLAVYFVRAWQNNNITKSYHLL